MDSFVDYLPFRYLAYTPTAILLGKIPAEHLPAELLMPRAGFRCLCQSVRIQARCAAVQCIQQS